MRAAVALVLIALPVAVFFQIRHHEFVDYDDRTYVVDNPNLRTELGGESILRAFREPYETNWIPLTWISLHVDYTLYGTEPAGYLLTNLALHVLGTLLLFAALIQLTGSTWRSAFVAAVFAIHPLHVESVAWASERKDTLSGLFWMATLLAYARYAKSPGLGRYLLVFLCLGLGLLAKPMLVTLPFVLLLLDYWPLGRLRSDASWGWPEAARLRRALLEKLPLFALVAASSAVTYVVQRDLGAMAHGDALPPSVRLPNALLSYAAYLREAFWPSGLAVFYPHLQSETPRALAALSGLALVLVSAGALCLARSRPYLAVGWLWYLGTLVPVIGVVQVGMQARADRYMYVPLVGLAIALAWAVADWVGPSPRRRAVAAVAGCASLGSLAIAAWFQVGHWRDTYTLYRRAIAVTEGNFLAEQGLGGQLLARGRPDEAVVHFETALRITPRWAGAHIGLADARAAQGRYEEAIRGYERGLRIAPRHARGHLHLAKALAEAGHTSEAIGRYRHGIQLAGGELKTDAYAALATTLVSHGDLEQAVELFETAVSRRPHFPGAHANLGFALLRLERPEAAEASLRRALSQGLDQAELHAGLGQAAQALRRDAEATSHYRDALARDPGYLPAANNLAWLLATSRDPSLRDTAEAVRVAEAAAARVRADSPAAVELLDTLATAYAATDRWREAEATVRRAAGLAAAQGDPERQARLEAKGRDYGLRRPPADPAP